MLALGLAWKLARTMHSSPLVTGGSSKTTSDYHSATDLDSTGLSFGFILKEGKSPQNKRALKDECDVLFVH